MKSSYQVGDRIKVLYLRQSFEGLFLESPFDKPEILLIKLDSGYNIGFPRKDCKIELVKKLVKIREETTRLKNHLDNKKPSIAMIITGGTIAARLDSKTGAVSWLDKPENLLAFYPELLELVNVRQVVVPFMKASEDMDYKDWQKIARVALPFLNDPSIKGIIITHGTDFLHYTAAALSFFLKNINKPVVLTYSQRSIDRASSDAHLNLYCAARAAISDIAEVMLVGHATSNDDSCYALGGTKVKKLHSSRRDAFKPINAEPLAQIFNDRIEFIAPHNFVNKEKKKVIVDTAFEEKIALVKFYPGQNTNILDYYMKNKYKGIVIEMSGLGHVATMAARKGWTRKLGELVKKGVIVCATSQTIFGRVDPFVYSNGREILNAGVIYLNDMLSETAFVKLGWVLGHKDWAKNKELVKQKMFENVAFEFNERLEE